MKEYSEIIKSCCDIYSTFKDPVVTQQLRRNRALQGTSVDAGKDFERNT